MLPSACFAVLCQLRLQTRVPMATLLVRWRVWRVGRKPAEMACWWAKVLTQSWYCWKDLVMVTQATPCTKSFLWVLRGVSFPPYFFRGSRDVSRASAQGKSRELSRAPLLAL